MGYNAPKQAAKSVSITTHTNRLHVLEGDSSCYLALTRPTATNDRAMRAVMHIFLQSYAKAVTLYELAMVSLLPSSEAALEGKTTLIGDGKGNDIWPHMYSCLLGTIV